MTDINTPHPAGEDNRPKLRCPACSFMVPLPAETCPRCQANLRTGVVEGQAEAETGRTKMILLGLTLLVIIGLAVVFFSGVLDGPKQAEAPPARSTDAMGGGPLDAFPDLPADRSNVGRPDIILDRTRQTMDRVEDTRRGKQEEAADFYPDSRD